MKHNMRKIAIYTASVILVAALSVGGGVLGARLSLLRQQSRPATGDMAFNSRATDTTAANTNSPVPTPINQTNTSAQSFEEQFRIVAAETLPVVVEINVMSTVTRPVLSSPFDFFFGNPRDGESKQREFTQQGLGSGVIVSRDGQKVYVLTNNHVAGKADEIEVVLSDQRTYKAELVGTDDLMDLALVSFTTNEKVPIATLGDSDSLSVGDWVFAVGNPLGFESTVTAGIVSANARIAQAGSGMSGITPYIQTDAAINQGNSGGALVNLRGEVVGINTWIASKTGGNIGLGFAIPINNAKRAILDFIDSGSVSYSWLGVQTGAISPDMAKELGISDTKGAFIFGVYEDSPAGKSGLMAGDLVIQIGNTPIADSNALIRTVAGMEVGARSAFSVIRDGKPVQLTVQTDKRDDSSGSDLSKLWPGITVVPINDEMRQQLSLRRNDRGVIIAAVSPESAAGGGGLQQGDLVTAVNGTQVRTVADFYRGINQQTDEIQFRIVRAGRSLTFGFEKPNA